DDEGAPSDDDDFDIGDVDAESNEDFSRSEPESTLDIDLSDNRESQLNIDLSGSDSSASSGNFQNLEFGDDDDFDFDFGLDDAEANGASIADADNDEPEEMAGAPTTGPISGPPSSRRAAQKERSSEAAPASARKPESAAKEDENEAGLSLAPRPSSRRRLPAAARKKLRKRRTQSVALIVAVLSIVVLFPLPLYLLRRVEAQVETCFAAYEANPNGDPAACLEDAWLAKFPGSMPWLETEAQQFAVDAKYRAATLAWDQATAIVPDNRKRAEAATAVVNAWNQAPEEHPGGNSPSTILQGAFSEQVELGLASDDKILRGHAFAAARAVGRLKAMKTLAQGGVAKTEPFMANMRRGAFLCLAGKGNGGPRALAFADNTHYHQSPTRSGMPLARLGLIACGKENALGPDTRNVGRLYMPALKGLEAGIGGIEGRIDGLDRVRVYLSDPKTRMLGESRLRLSSFVIAETKPSVAEALALLVPKNDKGARLNNHYLRTPWLLFDTHAPEQSVLVDLPATKAAAEYLETLLATPPDGPLSCNGDSCPAPAALANPMLTLREAASMLWISRASEAAKRGNTAIALQSLRRAHKLTPSRRVYQRAAIYLSVNRAKRALDVLRGPLSEPKRHSLTTQTRLLINQAFASAHLGQYRKAYDAAEQAFATAVMAENDARAALGERLTDLAALEDDKVTAGWLWGAMALKLGKARALGAKLAKTSAPSLGELAKWLKVASMKEDERRLRRRKLALPAKRLPRGAVPAALFVAGTVVPGSTDVEVWLDRIFWRQHINQPVRSMLARAEAARWRGDKPVVKLWADRVATVRKLIVDYRSAFLADLVLLR
ncbi:MAG: hypothetical protein VB934_12075, partial [Polyangiaceae bacterium]